MGIYFEIKEELGIIEVPLYEELADKVLNAVLDYLKCPFECEVSLYITDDEEIHQINLEQRNIDKSTDVLSFPMIEWDKKLDFDWLENQVHNFHPDSGELILGDVVVSYDTLVKQADEYGHTIEREYSFLIVHSLLHLMGYDHIKVDERVVMEEEQRRIMDILSIHR